MSSNEQSTQLEYPSSVRKIQDDSVQFLKVLTDHRDMLTTIKHEFRGEQLYQTDEGETIWVQVDKPMFIKTDENENPVFITKKDGRKEYVSNDDAINEIVDILKASGLNSISPLTIIDENEIRADLMEIESKVEVLLCIKRKKWGIDKALYPIIIAKIKTLIKDARYRAKDGQVLRAIKTITQRYEQTQDNEPKKVGIFK